MMSDCPKCVYFRFVGSHYQCELTGIFMTGTLRWPCICGDLKPDLEPLLNVISLLDLIAKYDDVVPQ